MKPDIHPKYNDLTVTCSCGNSITTRSTLGKPTFAIESCPKCHAFYTGKKKVAEKGAVERFRQKFGYKAKDKKEAE